MSEPHRMRLRNGVRSVGFNGETEPTYGEYVLSSDYDALAARLAEVERERDEWRGKALRFDLDAAGIARREAEAVELVELRARLAEAERERDLWYSRAVALFWSGSTDDATVAEIRKATDEFHAWVMHRAEPAAKETHDEP